MTSKRIIACLDVADGRVKKGTQFVNLADCGDPVTLAMRYETEGADEIVLLDISATVQGRQSTLNVIEQVASALFIPLTVGGGIRSVADALAVLRAGADKIALNSAAVSHPALIAECSKTLGAQCVVVSIDAKRMNRGWRVVTHGGRRVTELDAVEWARNAVQLGAGEILLTSIDQDGARNGYDLELLWSIGDRVTVPVIASGGAGNAQHLLDAFRQGASAALVAGMLHDGSATVRTIKRTLLEQGVEVRTC